MPRFPFKVCLPGLLVATSCTAFAELPAETPAQLEKVETTGEARIEREQKTVAQLLKARLAFDKYRALAPAAQFFVRLYPRRDPRDLADIALELRSRAGRQSLALDEQQRFEIDPAWAGLPDDAIVRSKLAEGRLAWHPDVRTPGLPPNTRRLGDLRLECHVDIYGADTLVRGIKLPAFYAARALTDVCARLKLYGHFADRPVFGITLVHGSRRKSLPYENLHGSLVAQDSPIFGLVDWAYWLRDRMYVVPLDDASWPDDTLLEFEDMDETALAADGGAR
ncbi:hypothetical protein RQP53_22015 [Paucibacter sp. APW11]|uniref:Uncharacterized protein n=1 Tax=Roseateles aquae TaxID=3077235 RepID=A0ABU3PHD0_9BURK|nr:hypothetical protein [Paucibacter sp. APW11]MDT9001969.1 hypothetical protein [Paucibacter sp. APW11]